MASAPRKRSLGALVPVLVALAVGGLGLALVDQLLRSCVPLRSGLGGYAVEDSVVAADGQSYYFLHESALQGYTWALARREPGSQPDILVSHGENLKGRDLLVVRPEPLKPGGDYYRMYASPEGWVAGVTDSTMVLAYNTRTFKAYSRGEFGGLSPFLLLGPTTPIHKPDVMQLVTNIRLHDKNAPTRAAVMKGLKHPNPEVQEAARRCLQAFQR